MLRQLLAIGSIAVGWPQETGIVRRLKKKRHPGLVPGSPETGRAINVRRFRRCLFREIPGQARDDASPSTFFYRAGLNLAALAFVSLPFISLAAATDAPLLVVEPSATAQAVPGAGFSNFPENAVTRVGENTTGQHVDAPTNPANPPTPANPAAASGAETPANPASPTPPANPISTLWPRNTVEIFMPSCAGFHVELVKPCLCVITRLMTTMPHDEFLKESEKGTLESDPRLLTIRTDCATAPKQKE